MQYAKRQKETCTMAVSLHLISSHFSNMYEKSLYYRNCLKITEHKPWQHLKSASYIWNMELFFCEWKSDFFKENMYLREKLETKAMRTILKKLQNMETLWFPPSNISAHYSFVTGHSLFIWILLIKLTN